MPKSSPLPDNLIFYVHKALHHCEKAGLVTQIEGRYQLTEQGKRQHCASVRPAKEANEEDSQSNSPNSESDSRPELKPGQKPIKSVSFSTTRRRRRRRLWQRKRTQKTSRHMHGLNSNKVAANCGKEDYIGDGDVKAPILPDA